jgi:PhnB protein
MFSGDGVVLPLICGLAKGRLQSAQTNRNPRLVRTDIGSPQAEQELQESFYKRAFGAEEVLRLSMPDGKVVHCELKFGDSRVNLGESMEGWPEHTLLAQIFVADSDAVFAQAVKAGAEVLSPMTDMFFGSREGRVLDPFGSTWTISTHKETVSVEEMQSRLNALAA